MRTEILQNALTFRNMNPQVFKESSNGSIQRGKRIYTYSWIISSANHRAVCTRVSNAHAMLDTKWHEAKPFAYPAHARERNIARYVRVSQRVLELPDKQFSYAKLAREKENWRGWGSEKGRGTRGKGMDQRGWNVHSRQFGFRRANALAPARSCVAFPRECVPVWKRFHCRTNAIVRVLLTSPRAHPQNRMAK